MVTDENHKVYMEKEKLKTTGLYSPRHPSQGQNVVNLWTVLHYILIVLKLLQSLVHAHELTFICGFVLWSGSMSGTENTKIL